MPRAARDCRHFAVVDPAMTKYYLLLTVLFLSSCTRVPNEQKPHPSYPEVSPDANMVYRLHSNKEKTHFYVDGEKIGVGRRIKIRIDDRAHTVKAKPENCIAKEEFIQPPYYSHSPLSFTFLMGECSGEVISAGPDFPEVLPPLANNGSVDFGQYYALVIGNNRYRHLPDLKTAVNDAESIKEILKNRYAFNVELLLNASRADILEALTKYRKELTQSDNLLIYYAGHGELDELADRGYWLPVDAEEENPTQWISVHDITGTLQAMMAKHVIVVADSCYSGKLTRGLARIYPKPPDYLQRLAYKRARTALSSGDIEPVVDDGGEGNHSVFASAFMRALSENAGILEGAALFAKIRRLVMLKALQTPQYGDIRGAGHEGGDFLFVKTTPNSATRDKGK